MLTEEKKSMGFETSNHLTPEEKKIQQQREAYDKQAKRDASDRNGPIENLTGKGLDKEDIIRIDASLEDKFREAVAEVGDDMDEAQKARLLNSLQKSALQEEVLAGHEGVLGDRPVISRRIEGLIDGKQVSITRTQAEGNDKSSKSNERDYYIDDIEGSIDGKRISSSFAREIYDTYADVAKIRTQAIEDAYMQKRQSSLGEGKEDWMAQAKKADAERIRKVQEKIGRLYDKERKRYSGIV